MKLEKNLTTHSMKKKKYKRKSQVNTKEELDEIRKANSKALDKILARKNWMEWLGKKYYGSQWMITLDGTHPSRLEHKEHLRDRAKQRKLGKKVKPYIPATKKPIVQLDLDDNLLGRYESANSWCEVKERPIQNAQSLVKAAKGQANTAFGFKWMFEEEYNKLNK